MSATTRRAKAAELHAENERLRSERNAMIGTNAELIKEIDILHDRLNSEAEAANTGANRMPIDHEHQEQTALFQAAQAYQSQYPELGLLFAIPNGGKRSRLTAAKLKAEGVKAGVPDIFLPAARSPYHGMFIELKAIYPNGRRGGTKNEQRAWIKALRERGYHAIVAYGWEDALAAILEYIKGTPWK